MPEDDVVEDGQDEHEVDVLVTSRAGPAYRVPVDRGSGVAAVGPCPPRLPPPDHQRPRGEVGGVLESTGAEPSAAPALAAFFAAA